MVEHIELFGCGDGCPAVTVAPPGALASVAGSENPAKNTVRNVARGICMVDRFMGCIEFSFMVSSLLSGACMYIFGNEYSDVVCVHGECFVFVDIGFPVFGFFGLFFFGFVLIGGMA